MTLQSVTTSSRPDLEPEANAAFRERWPEFIFHDPVPPRFMPRVHDYFPQYDILLLDDGRVADGLSVDPWIRTHQRMGARIVRPAPNSMVIPGTVAEWESWADMPFPESGDYIVPDALNVVKVDRERDEAVYSEESLWVEHTAAH